MGRRVAQAQADQIADADVRASESTGETSNRDIKRGVGEAFAIPFNCKPRRLAMGMSGDQGRDVHQAADADLNRGGRGTRTWRAPACRRIPGPCQ